MYADVLPNRALPPALELLTYRIPQGLAVQSGHTVQIPFRNKRLAATVCAVHNKKPSYQTRDIIDVYGEAPALTAHQQALMQFLHSHYKAPLSHIVPLLLPRMLWKKSFSAAGERAPQNKPKPTLILGTLKERLQQYRPLIKKTLARKKQVLVLVSEVNNIATVQKALGIKVYPVVPLSEDRGVRFTHELFNTLREGKTACVIATRHALFLPFSNLGLIVMDSEEDESYKSERSPRYHARTVAYKLRELTGAHLVFGSQTPDLETYHQHNEERWKTFGRLAYPFAHKTKLIDMADERKRGNYSPLSQYALIKITEVLTSQKPALIFINRIGTANAVYCLDCGKLPRCETCDRVLTYYRHEDDTAFLACYRCRKERTSPTRCMLCNGSRLKLLGAGTHGMQEELRKQYGRARITRLDRTHTERELQTIIVAPPSDLVVATKMVLGKQMWHGLFGTVIALDIDSMLHRPHFAAHEHTLHLLVRLSNFLSKNGELVIQTRTPEHAVFAALQRNALADFYDRELRTRRLLAYPPFASILQLTIEEHRKTQTLKQKIQEIDPAAHTHEHRSLDRGKTLTRLTIKSRNIDDLLEKLPLPHWNIDREVA